MVICATAMREISEVFQIKTNTFTLKLCVHKPHDVVVNLHEGRCREESTDIGVQHLKGAFSKQLVSVVNKSSFFFF